MYMASVQHHVEGDRTGEAPLPQLERKSRVQRSKDGLERCLRQINGHMQRNRLQERNQGPGHEELE